MHVPACCGNSGGYRIAKPSDFQVRVVRVMLSNGGLGSTETAAAFPVRLIESGPVAGAIVGRQIAQVLALPEILPAGGQLLHRSALGILPPCRHALPSP